MGIPSPIIKRIEPNRTAPSVLCIMKQTMAEMVIIDAKVTGLFQAFLLASISKIENSLKVRESNTTLVSIIGV